MGGVLGAAGSLISAGSSLFGGGESGGGGSVPEIEFDASAYASSANEILDRALEQAIPYSERGTQFAIEALKNFYLQSRKDTMERFRQSKVEYQKMYDVAQAKLEPYVQSGYGALDRYQDILGMPRFAAGSSAVAAAKEKQGMQNAARQELRNQGANLLDMVSDQLDPQSLKNLQASINSGGNPEGIMLALQQMGITKGRDRFRTDFPNPELKTLGWQIDEEGSLTGEQRSIPSILGDVANDLGRFNNELYGNLQSYLNPAMQSYATLLQNTIPSNQRSILNAIRSGTTQNPSWASVYTGE